MIGLHGLPKVRSQPNGGFGKRALNHFYWGGGENIVEGTVLTTNISLGIVCILLGWSVGVEAPKRRLRCPVLFFSPI